MTHANPEIRALIVDDEEPGRINLRHALATCAGWQVAGECASASEARGILDAHDVDVVFLDIQMPKESGLALARTLVGQDEPPLIIFVTAYNSYAVEAFEVHALDYLLKPFDDLRLAQATERAAAMLALRQRRPYAEALRSYLVHQAAEAQDVPQYLQQLSVRSVGRIESIQLADVAWMAAAGNYVELHTAGRSILHRVPLGKLVERLDPAVFLRVHRSAIVRRDQLASLSVVGDGSYMLDLRDGERVAVSERYVNEVRASMGEK